MFEKVGVVIRNLIAIPVGIVALLLYKLGDGFFELAKFIAGDEEKNHV